MGPFTIENFAEATLLGVALAMDAMAVTLSNSLCEPNMPLSKKLAMPLAFAVFQVLMPVLGYFGGTLIAHIIDEYAGIVSLAILAFVGGKMIMEAIEELRHPEACSASSLTFGTIGLEAIATSIDALVVGVSFVAGGKNVWLYSGAIGVTTFFCCLFVLLLGRKLGERFGSHAQIAGGLVLIAIGIQAFFS